MVPGADADDDGRAAEDAPAASGPGQVLAAGERSVALGRDAINPVIVTGDHNQVVERLVQIGAPTGPRDLEIRIGAESPDGTFPVSAWVMVEERRVDGVFRLSCSELEARSGVAALEAGGLDDADVKQLGARLFGALFAGPLKELYDDSRRGDPALRFRIVLEDPALASLPWELLYDPERGEYLARDGTIVRGTTAAAPARPLRIRAPVRLLVVDAFPKGLPRMDGQLTALGVGRALRRLVRNRQLDVTTLTAATRQKLRAALAQATHPRRRRPFQLVHVVGYARHDPASGRTALLLLDERGEVDEVDAGSLADLLGPDGPRLVFFSAARSAQSTALGVARAFAPDLLASGVPAVIAQQATVLDEAGAEAFRGFYGAIVDGWSVDTALATAQPPTGARPLRDEAGLGAAVCYLRPESGRLLEVQPAEEVTLSRTTWQPWLRQRATPGRIASGAVTAVVVIASLLTAYAVFAPAGPEPPAPLGPMTGDLNIAVAEFGRRGDDDRVSESADGKALALDVSEYFENQIQTIAQEIEPGGPPFRIEVRKAPDTGLIDAQSQVERARVAEKLAHDIQTDVVVYGNLETRAGGTGFVPEFYLSTRKLLDAEELGGHHVFGTPIEAGGNIADNAVARRELRTMLLERTRAQARFVIGVGYYALNRFDLAAAYFDAAAATDGWPDRRGKEVIYLFLGNTAGKRGDLATAQAFYQRALASREDYARALLGAAEIRYHASRADCQPGRPNAAGLRESLEGYQAARMATSQPVRSTVPSMLAFGMGRVYVCLSRARIEERWREAELELRKVIDELEGGNERVRDRAAEAYGMLAIVYAPLEDDPAPAAKFARVIQEYEKARDTSRRADRQAVFSSALGYTYGELKAYDQADAEYARAIELDPRMRARIEPEREALRRMRARAAGSPPIPTGAGR